MVDELSCTRFRGWAANNNDFSDHIIVSLDVGGELLLEVVADVHRPDLEAHHFGDGRLGFDVHLGSDAAILFAANPDGITVRGRSEKAGPCPLVKYYSPTADGAGAVVDEQPPIVRNGYRHPGLGAATPAIFGSCFLLDNINVYAPELIAPMHDIAAYRKPAGFFAMHMVSFGDYMWWDGPVENGVRSASRFFEPLEPAVRSLIAQGKLMLLFDMSNEGPPARHYRDWLALLHEELDRQRISPSSCVLINQNRAFERDYRLWAREAGAVELLRIVNYDYYIDRMAAQLNALPYSEGLPSDPPRDAWRHFICLNFSPRPERTSFISWLVGSGLIDQGFVSFGGFSNLKADGTGFSVPDWFPDNDVAVRGMVELRNIGSLSLDLDQNDKTYIPEFDLGPVDNYRRSFFSIVTESDFSPGDVVRITEKVLKPMALGHPIVIMGNAGSIPLLREFGFEGFSPFIDESYDLYDNPAERMLRVQNEVRRLAALSYEEHCNLRQAMAPILQHNMRHARRGLAELYRTTMRPRVIEHLAELYRLCPARTQ